MMQATTVGSLVQAAAIGRVRAGPTGVGLASAVFPSLKGQWAGYSETQLRSFRDGLRMNVMMNGVAKNMSDADIEAVSSYVEGLK